ncbi:MAG: SsrA-binding protein SmpB [Candidatus Babeliaceae bacterium]|nr:SsrA-binding protein SmpB [Candidatus Babeliaceae bacterium]
MKIITQNKKAFHDYDILEKYETGIVLKGDEVKSLRAGHVQLVGAFGSIHNNELFLINCQISPYSHAYQKLEEMVKRSRKLLVSRKELNRIMMEVAKKGVTLVPLKLYFNQKGLVKVELALCKHKKAHQRKEDIKERDIARETRRELRGKYNA